MRDPLAFTSSVDPRVRYCRVLAGPKLRRARFDVVREFDAVSHDVLTQDGMVMETPTTSKPFDVFLIDWLASFPKIMLLITFIDIPLATGLLIRCA
jgi:hypothetical protein